MKIEHHCNRNLTSWAAGSEEERCEVAAERKVKGVSKLYRYYVVRENPLTGETGKRTKVFASFLPELKVGGLYCHLGPGFPGFQRVLYVEVEDLGEEGDS